MAVESSPVQATSPQEQAEKPVKPAAESIEQQQPVDVDNVHQKVEAVTLGENGSSELHAACASGRVEDVKSLLSKGVGSLEALDINTGCTPVVLAIRANHHDVVRELLTAGAIVPPPGLTSDPLMLSILYPQPVYGVPPQFMGIPPQDFYPPPNYFPQSIENQQFAPRKESVAAINGNNANGQASGANPNLPPAEVSKSIPCRNFPNCKYGSSCVFRHPRPPVFYQGPGQNGVGFPPQGYESYPPYPPAPMPYFVPNGNGFQSFSAEGQRQGDEAAHDGSAPIPVPGRVPSAVAPVFVPGYQPGDMMGSPPPAHFGMSPMSPSMLGTSLPSIPPADVFFATSPNNGFSMPPPPMNAHARRQSFGQGPGAQFGAKPFGHGKKPSFSGGKLAGARPLGGKHGVWKDGNPPPCAFYAQGNCRNGEFCKFPHLDAEGNDCRHPDVVRGILPPLPTMGSQKRNVRMMGPGPGFQSFDPSFNRQQQYQQQMQFLQHQRLAAAQAQQGQAAGSEASANNEAKVSETAETTESAEKEAVTSASEALATPAAPAPSSATVTLPAKPAASIPTLLRSASQPGVQRVHANGLSSRSHSPAPSNVSFHGNGHPRRAGSHAAHANGSTRSASNGPEKKASQRIPSADEFPVLGTPTGEKKEPVWGVKNGMTAAQVLQAPAPVKAQPAKDDDAASSKDGQSVTMESEDDSDAVIVSHKPSAVVTPATTASPAPTSAPAATASPAPSTAPAAAPAAPAASAPEQKKLMSFASIAGASKTAQAVEAAATSVKA